nr:N-6 DNA methylase [Halopelagius inordinatus]
MQDNVFTALRVLGEGFVAENELALDPGDEDALNELKEQSLVLLYRLMFTLYAESRDLINPDDPAKRREYDQNFSLDELRREILDDIGKHGREADFEDAFSEHSTTMWNRLENLFSLIDSGEESLGIPPYNGGLFDAEEHGFLTENDVSDRHVAEVIYRLSTTETDDGFVPADYADLDTRHLGSIYEGLLEHEFRIAPTHYAAVSEDGGQVWKDASEVSVADAVEEVESGELYVVNDDGERKATGAYYTPDYVVTYIVEETVDPLVEEIESDLSESDLTPGTQEYVVEFWNRVTDLKILDPAMGSGHFLTKATGYLAETVMEHVRELETATLFDEQQIRREISRECIYGVDLNGMAVELAKLSMWLETLATDQPLAFLDHHLKAGNSLVGSDITDVLAEDDESDDGQLTLTQALAHVRQRTLEHVMELMQDLLAIDNESYEDVKSMEDIYAEIRADPLYQRLFEMANVHTAERFGVDVPSDAYEEMAQAIEDSETWDALAENDWFASAQTVADDEEFFHWELEYPEVFFSADGEKAVDAGFDAVVGNPPWLRFQRIPENHRNYQRANYHSAAAKYDIYGPFIESSLDRIHRTGLLGFVVQNRFLSSGYGEELREVICRRSNVRALLDFEDAPIFGDTTTYPAIIILDNSSRCSFNYLHLSDATVPDVRESLAENNERANKIDANELDPSNIWIFPDIKERNVIQKIESNAQACFGDLIEISKSVSTNLKEAFLFEGEKNELPVEDELLTPAVDGKDIKKYSDAHIDKYLLFPYTWSTSGPNLVDISSYPRAENHLRQYEEELRSRRYYNKTIEEAGVEWYEYPHVKENHNKEKILFPDISTEPRCTFDEIGDVLTLTTAYGGVRQNSPIDVRYLCAIFNSSPVSMVFKHSSPQMSGGYYRYQPQYIEKLPLYLPEVPEGELNVTDIEISADDYIESDKTSEYDCYKAIIKAAENARSYRSSRDNLNLSLPDHLGNYAEGQTLGEIGFRQPVSDTANGVFNDTTEDREKLGVTEVEFERENANTLTVSVGVRYKPENPDDYETDTYGYYYEDPEPAFRITDLTETEADLIEAFVPHAVEEAGGYANFRTNATKTNSPLDRLKKLTLPEVDDVRDGLANYVETVERAEELDEKIERTDELIDEIVYELYGLTEEEIEIVEESVKE